MKNSLHISHNLGSRLQVLQQYRYVIFVVFVAVLYGFVLMRISALSNAEPTPDAVQSQVQATRNVHIDDEVVKQLESLEDNSVSVQSLFDQARNNPF